MGIENFKQSIQNWTSICIGRNYSVEGINSKKIDFENLDFNESQKLQARLAGLYNTALFVAAPILHAVGETFRPEELTPHLVFDSLPLDEKEERNYLEKVEAAKANGSPRPLFIDLNYLDSSEKPILGLRLIDKGEDGRYIKVINLPEFYLLGEGNYDYLAYSLEDRNGMNLLIARITEHFSVKNRVSQPKIP